MSQKHVPITPAIARRLAATGQRVRLLRKARGHTSFSLAAALGLSQAHVSRIETGLQGLRYVTLLRLAKVLNVSPTLFTVEDRHVSLLRERLPPDTIRGIELID